jgi:hypothetical protein
MSSLDSDAKIKLHAVGKNKLQSLDKTCKSDNKPFHDISTQEHGNLQIYLYENSVVQKQADV